MWKQVERTRMRQLTLASQGTFEEYRKKTRREKFLEEMDRIVPWPELESLIEPYYPKEGNGRPPVGMGIMLRIYFYSTLVQPVGSGGGRGVVRFAGTAAVCRR
jgi:hypothetical protein